LDHGPRALTCQLCQISQPTTNNLSYTDPRHPIVGAYLDRDNPPVVTPGRELVAKIFKQRPLVHSHNHLTSCLIGDEIEQARKLYRVKVVHTLNRVIQHKDPKLWIVKEVKREEQR